MRAGRPEKQEAVSEDSEKGVQGPLEELQQGVGMRSWVEVQSLRCWAEGSDRELEITFGVRDGPSQACRVWGFLSVWLEPERSDRPRGSPFLGWRTSKF